MSSFSGRLRMFSSTKLAIVNASIVTETKMRLRWNNKKEDDGRCSIKKSKPLQRRLPKRRLHRCAIFSNCHCPWVNEMLVARRDIGIRYSFPRAVLRGCPFPHGCSIATNDRVCRSPHRPSLLGRDTLRNWDCVSGTSAIWVTTIRSRLHFQRFHEKPTPH